MNLRFHTLLIMLMSLGLAPVHAWTVSGVSAGHDGWFKRGRWIPVEITCVNGGTAFDGVLAIEVDGDLRFGQRITAGPGSSVRAMYWVTAHSARPHLSLVAIDESGEFVSPLEVSLRELEGPLVAVVPGALGTTPLDRWRVGIPRPSATEVTAIDWPFDGWRRDSHALEALDGVVLGLDAVAWRRANLETAAILDAWVGLGGRVADDPLRLDLSSWSVNASPSATPAALAHSGSSQTWPDEWRRLAVRALGAWLVLVGVVTVILRAVRVSRLSAIVGITAAAMAGVVLVWRILPDSRVGLDVVSVVRTGSGARVQGTALQAPVERFDWCFIEGVAPGAGTAELPVGSPLRRLSPAPQSSSGGSAGLITGEAGSGFWRASAKRSEERVVLEGTTLRWEPTAISAVRDSTSTEGHPRWRCIAQDTAIEAGDQYFTDGKMIWIRAGAVDSKAPFAWPSDETGITLWKFTETAARLGDDAAAFRIRVLVTTIERLPPGGRYLLAFAGRDPIEQPRAGFLRCTVHPTLWVVEVR